MKNWHWLLMVLSLVLALQACGEDEDGGGGTGGTGGAGGTGGTGGTGGGGADTDNDGIPDAEDPTPNGSTNNKLNGTFSGGSASVVEITATLGNGVEDLDYVYNDDLTVGCDNSWYPQGTLCDESPTTDSPTTSTKQDADSGATWYAYTDPEDDPPVTGFLVIDACSDDSCTAVDFNEARVFQMFSDGKTTHLRLSIHPDRGDTAPAWDDDGWVTVTDFEPIGAGTDVNGDALVVGDPTVFSTGPRVTRYVRVEARNDGTHDEGDYTELRSLKLFSVSAE
jgi:hypothetical protein